MLERLRRNPLPTAIGIFVLYVVMLTLTQTLFSAWGPSVAPGTSPEVQVNLSLLPASLIVAALLTLAVARLGWGRQVGFRGLEPGGLKYVLVPLILITVVFAVYLLTLRAAGGQGVLGMGAPLIALGFIASLLLVGYTEELMFRGVLLYGALTRFTPALAVLVTALGFGAFHFLNLTSGQSLSDTLSQVVQTATMGFMLAALRLRVGSIVPIMLYHAVWDFLLGDVQVLRDSQQGLGASGSPAPAGAAPSWETTLVSALPALLYGAFVLWRYYVARAKGRISAPLTETAMG